MIHMTLPGIPPSVDHAYRPVVDSGRAILIMTTEGKAFKREATAHLAKTYPTQLKWLKGNSPYAFYARYYMPKLENETYPKSAKTRYKRVDTTNRIKLLEDVISEISAVDDAHYMLSLGHKLKGPKEETKIWIWNLEEEACPIYEAALTL